MGGTPYLRLARACESINALSGRKDKVAQIVKLLQEVGPEEAAPAILLLIGRVAPEGDEDKLEIGAAAIYQLLEEAGQTTLLASEPPTILDVWNGLREISRLRGPGSRERKLAILRGLLAGMSDLEKRWFLKQLMGEMQHGANEGLVLEAIAELTGASTDEVQRAFMLLGRLGDLVELALRGGREAIKSVRLQVFRPVRPMLAEMCHDLEQLLKESEKPMSFEYKFDGARVQIHVKDGEVRIFSRRLSEVTRSLPDIVQVVRGFSSSFHEIVLDGEVVAVDETGRPMPFQELLRRFRRLREVEEEAERIPLKLWIFDILYLDGRELLDMPYRERRELLEKLIPAEYLAPRIVTSSIEEVQAFMRRAMEEGHEGLMAKNLDSPYRPGRRERLWLKIKPADTLDLVIVAADWGHGRRMGWLSNYHLAAYNPETGEFEVVGKTFKGLTDEEFEWMTKRLLELKISDDGYTVTVRPRIVVEVAYNEIQKSPKYKSGYALRFARITRVRADKAPEEADTIQRIRELYERQFERKRLPKEIMIWRLRG
ncbi:MAG: ATP-dependent DNA ligase [Thaumarchaeota archaeon]|jgi:DNA ligase-1|nr:ATP-dependent DNA ligase [Nitrososphaerota archaeon]MCL7386420.1 ATP-dependent DNA ligase [Candidatus Wolframiiraptor allenii]